MKLLLTGAAGLVGHQVAQEALQRGWDVLALYRENPPPPAQGLTVLQADLAEPDTAAVPHILEFFPDAVVNATGVTETVACEVDPKLAERLNVGLPRTLAQIANHISARFLHLSTEQVFDGTAAPYSPTDMPCPRHLYGQLKLLSEKAVLESGRDYAVVLRLPLLTGNSPSGNRSVHERLLQALARGEIPALYTNMVRQPTRADNVARLIIELCERPSLKGIFHWAGTEVLSRHEIGIRTLRYFGLPESLVTEAECDPESVNADLRLHYDTLFSKVKTPVMNFEDQLQGLEVPEACREWFLANSSRPERLGMPRLIKGRDF